MRHRRPCNAGELRIEIRESVGQERGLVSLGTEPNEVLLSLPYNAVFMDTEVLHIWRTKLQDLG